MKLMAAGDQVLVAEFGDRIDEAVNDQVHALAAKIEEQQIPGIGEVVPTFRSLLIYYDSYQLSYREAADKIEELARNLKTEQKTKKRILKIPCCYGARFGPDLADMEQLTGLDRKEMIDIHSSVDYKVYMLGFLPGFAYLGGLDERIHVPRLKSPRLKISRGAVGIGGSQTGIYPMDSPGGWRLMGETPIDMYDPNREQPILVQAGDYIRFVPITIMDYYDIRRAVLDGKYQIEVTEA